MLIRFFFFFRHLYVSIFTRSEEVVDTVVSFIDEGRHIIYKLGLEIMNQFASRKDTGSIFHIFILSSSLRQAFVKSSLGMDSHSRDDVSSVSSHSEIIILSSFAVFA